MLKSQEISSLKRLLYNLDYCMYGLAAELSRTTSGARYQLFFDVAIIEQAKNELLFHASFRLGLHAPAIQCIVRPSDHGRIVHCAETTRSRALDIESSFLCLDLSLRVDSASSECIVLMLASVNKA